MKMCFNFTKKAYEKNIKENTFWTISYENLIKNRQPREPRTTRTTKIWIGLEVTIQSNPSLGAEPPVVNLG